MAGKTKIVPTMFLVYDYDKEEDYLNAMSLKGWQLKKGGMYHHTYTKDDQLYRYRLDFNDTVLFNNDEYSRYISFYQDQGWEHINKTLNGWHYFRKKYDPDSPEEEYEIYTDDSTLKGMLSKWVRIARIFQFIFLLLFLNYMFTFLFMRSTLYLTNLLLIAVGTTLLEFCIRKLKKKTVITTNPKSSGRSGYLLFGGLGLIIIFSFALIFYHPTVYQVHVTSEINQHTPDYTAKMTVKHNGYYRLHFKSKSERGTAGLMLVKDGNTVYYTGSGQNFYVTNPMIYLQEGKYTVKVIYYLEDYEKEFHATKQDLKRLHLDGDLNQMSDIDFKLNIKDYLLIIH